MKRSERKLLEKEAGVTATTEDEARAYVGCKVAKYSGKPFKSGKRIATVSSWGWIHCNDGKTKFGLKLEAALNRYQRETHRLTDDVRDSVLYCEM